MQVLNAPPRDGLTAAQVTALLTGPTVAVSAGAELLTPALAFVQDISDDLAGGSVERVMNATVHGTCNLSLSRALAWGTDLIRPYMTLTAGAVSARFNLGVYSLATPVRQIGVNPETYDVQGYDRIYLLDRPVGDTYTVAAGVGFLAAVRTAITASGLSGVSLDGAAEAKTLPVAMVWPLIQAQTGADGKPSSSSTSWLGVVNDLLGAVGYTGLWADENGSFRSNPYALPATRSSEFTFTADDTNLTIVGEQRDFTQDTWAVPNRWVFIQQNRDPAAAVPVEGAGIYTVNNTADGLTSQTARGLVWAKVVSLDAADQSSLVTQGNNIVAADQRVTASLKVTTGPWPVAQHRDIYTYADSALGASRKVQATRWSFDLSGSDVTWEMEVV